MPNITMTYGDYSFVPVPIITVAKSLQKSNDNTRNGNIFDINLNGNLTAITGGLINVINLQNQLRNGVKEEGRAFVVKCDDNVLISGYPRITQAPQFNESSNNWTFTSPYSLSLQFDDFLNYAGDTTGDAPPYIAELNESWSVEQIEDNSYFDIVLSGSVHDVNPYQIRLTHNISAIGKAHYDSGGLVKPAWQQARDAVITNLGYNSSFLVQSGVLNFNSTGFLACNHVRTNETDIRGGGYNVTENWLSINTGQNGGYKAIEDYTVDINTDTENGNITNVNIQGSIQGLEERTYGSNPNDYTIATSKYTNASGLWSAVQNKLYSRAALFSNGVADRPINIQPMTKTVGHNPSKGVITYTYNTNDRPALCISGALFESFNVSDSLPNDIYASIFILGKSNGPVLQDLNSSGVRSRELNVEVRLKPVTGCPTSAANISGLMAASPKSQVDVIVNAFRQDLINNYSQVFVNQDNEVWNFRNGNFSRNISWTFSNC